MGCTQSKTRTKPAATSQPQARYAAPAEDDDVYLDKPVAVDDVEIDLAGMTHRGRDDSEYRLCGPTALPGLDLELAGRESMLDGNAHQFDMNDAIFVYSDTNYHVVKVTYSTGQTDGLRPVDATREDKGGKHAYTVMVYPGETKQVWSGRRVAGFSRSASATALPAESSKSLNASARAAESGIAKAIAAVEAVGVIGDAEATLAACVEQGVPYVDLYFKPLSENLGASLPAATWMRPTEFIPEKHRKRINLIRDGIEPDDIDQGRLGDCWLLCGIASLAEDAEKVKDMLRHPTRNVDRVVAERKIGAYRVTVLNKIGWWETMVLDDYLPTIGKLPCFARNREDPAELWVALVEKAFARMHGGYARIIAGQPRDALQSLTGYPTEHMDFKNSSLSKDELHDRLVKFASQGYMMSIATPKARGDAAQDERYKAAGLGMEHAYSILEAKHFPENDDLRLVKIRNPWGNGTEWTGEWGDDSALWAKHPQVKKECKFAPGADGTFWMAWKDACDHFVCCDICFVERDWHDYRIKGKFDQSRPSFIVEMKVTKPTSMYVIVSQEDRWGLAQDDPAFPYYSVMTSVCDPDPDDQSGKKYKATQHSDDEHVETTNTEWAFCHSGVRDLAMKVVLQPREAPYLIVTRAHSSNSAPKPFTMGIIASTEAGSGFEAKLVQPPSDLGYFVNYGSFEYTTGTLEPVTTELQYNPEIGCPRSFAGSQLQTPPPPPSW